MASTFRSRNTAKSGYNLKKAKESRAAEAMRMKNEQLRMLADQNVSMLKKYSTVYRGFCAYYLSRCSSAYWRLPEEH